MAYDLENAAAQVGLSARTLDKAIRSGELVAHRSGAKKLILHKDLEAWIESLPTERAGTRE